MKVKPFCSKCKTDDPPKVLTADNPDMINPIEVYWFKPDADGRSTHMGLNADGEVDFSFMALLDRDFDYDQEKEGPILCGECLEEAYDNEERQNEQDDL